VVLRQASALGFPDSQSFALPGKAVDVALGDLDVTAAPTWPSSAWRSSRSS
jgi:hypothetical protein